MTYFIKKISGDDNFELSLCVGTTPIKTWHTNESFAKGLNKYRSKSDQKLNSNWSVPYELTELNDEILDSLLIRKLFQVREVSTPPIWHSESVKMDFPAVQRVLSRLQTAKPQAHGIEIKITSEGLSANDAQLLADFEQIKASILIITGKTKIDSATLSSNITAQIKANYFKDSQDLYGGSEQPSFESAILLLNHQFFISALDSPFLLYYMNELVQQEPLIMGSICAIVEILNDIGQSVRPGEYLNMTCGKGIKSGLALLDRRIKTIKRIEQEREGETATIATINEAANEIIVNGLHSILSEIGSDMPFVQYKNDSFLRIIHILQRCLLLSTAKTTEEFNDHFSQIVNQYKIEHLDDFEPDEAEQLIQNLIPLIAPFCEKLERLFEENIKKGLLKTDVAQKERGNFPEDLNADGFLEQQFCYLLSDTDNELSLAAIATSEDGSLGKKYNAAISQQICRAIHQCSTHESPTFFKKPRQFYETIAKAILAIVIHPDVKHFEDDDKTVMLAKIEHFTTAVYQRIPATAFEDDPAIKAKIKEIAEELMQSTNEATSVLTSPV